MRYHYIMDCAHLTIGRNTTVSISLGESSNQNSGAVAIRNIGAIKIKTKIETQKDVTKIPIDPREIPLKPYGESIKRRRYAPKGVLLAGENDLRYTAIIDAPDCEVYLLSSLRTLNLSRAGD